MWEVLGMKPSADCMRNRSGTVALLVADDEHRLLVLWHEKYRFWTVPLGKIEDGEIDVRAAHREAFEELGIVSEKVDLIETIHKPADLDEYSDIFISICQVKSYKGEIENREPHKHRELHFVHIDEIEHLQPLSYPTWVIAGKLNSAWRTEIVS
jgi:8-oxo-dGTP pyrophosphatase MutT (NUDIX family)